LDIQAVVVHSSYRMMEYYTHTDNVIDFMAMRKKMGKVVGGVFYIISIEYLNIWLFFADFYINCRFFL